MSNFTNDILLTNDIVVVGKKRHSKSAYWVGIKGYFEQVSPGSVRSSFFGTLEYIV